MPKVKIFSLRIPRDIHSQLVKLSKREARSVNSEILYLIRQELEKKGESKP